LYSAYKFNRITTRLSRQIDKISETVLYLLHIQFCYNCAYPSGTWARHTHNALQPAVCTEMADCQNLQNAYQSTIKLIIYVNCKIILLDFSTKNVTKM